MSAAIPNWRFRSPQATPLLQLVTATLVLLYAPKLLALMVLLTQPDAVKAHGGVANILRSVVLESIFATLFAPVVMLTHSWFLLNIVLGRATGWGTQTRDDRALPFWFVFGNIGRTPLIGALAAIGAVSFRARQPGMVRAAAAGPDPGHSAGRDHLQPQYWARGLARARSSYQVPSETTTIPVLKRAHQLLTRREAQAN